MFFNIDYDPYFREEAEAVSAAIQNIFGYKCRIRRKQHPELLRFNQELGVYQVRRPLIENTIYITGNQIATSRARHMDEAFLGVAFRPKKVTLLSLAMLLNKREAKEDKQKAQKEYLEHLKRLVIHEIGHWAVGDQLDYDDYARSIFDVGSHCRDARCVMYPGGTKLLTGGYEKYFCDSCYNSLKKEL